MGDVRRFLARVATARRGRGGLVAVGVWVLLGASAARGAEGVPDGPSVSGPSRIAPTAAAAGAPSLPPRLWQATRVDPDTGRTQRVYLLGVTHEGLPGEHDAYFERVVLPLARTAGTFALEAPALDDGPFGVPACPRPLATEAGRAQVDAIRERAVRVQVARQRRWARASGFPTGGAFEAHARRDAERLVAPLSEFALAGWMRLLAAQEAAQAEREGRARRAAESEDVAARLRREVAFPRVEDVDGWRTLWSAYCGMGDERAALLAAWTSFEALERLAPPAPEHAPARRAARDGVDDDGDGDAWAAGDGAGATAVDPRRSRAGDARVATAAAATTGGGNGDGDGDGGREDGALLRDDEEAGGPVGVPHARPDIAAARDGLARELADSLATGRLQGRWVGSPDFERSLVCGRSAVWTPRLLAAGRDAPAFYALGIAHLLPSERATCPGLLADLAAQGFAVTRVE